MTHYFERLVALALTGLILSITAHHALAAGSTVTGKVRDGNGAAVVDVTINLVRVSECNCSDCQPEQARPCTRCCAQQRTTTTDRNGLYEFSEIPPGEYEVKFEATGFAKYTSHVTVKRGQQTAEANIDLTVSTGSIEVHKKCGFFCAIKKAFRSLF